MTARSTPKPTHRRLAVERQRTLALTKKLIHSHIYPRSLALRDSTIEKTIESANNESPHKFPFHKTSPLSNVPNFQYLRHQATAKKARIAAQKQGQFYNLNQNSPVKMIQEGVFQSPGETIYGFGHTVISIRTPGGTRDTLHPLEEKKSKKKLGFGDLDSLSAPKRISEVSLSYNSFSRPAGKENTVNNKRAQGGYSANDLFQLQFNDFKNQIIEAGLADEEELDQYLTDKRTFRFEHTHLIASHFGRLTTHEGQTVSPSDPESTFVGTEHLNTEMMLFEKFADFLLYINHKKHGHPAHEKTVDYSCKVIFAEDTTTAIGLQLTIKDKHTGIEFVQTWDNPYAVTEKPTARMYTELLLALKQGLNRRLQPSQ
jgi:hypothetical protein